MSKKHLGTKHLFNKKDYEKVVKKSEHEGYSVIHEYFKKLSFYIHDNNPRNYIINSSHPKSDGRVSHENVRNTLIDDINAEEKYTEIEKENIIRDWINQGSINTWLTKRNKEGKVNYITLSELPEDIKIYARRLFMLELKVNPELQDIEMIDDNDLEITEGYKTAIEKCFYGFSDPIGDKVDLIAQREILIEYDRRLWKEESTQDIDTYLALTPWMDDGKIYGEYVDIDIDRSLRIDGITITPENEIYEVTDDELWAELWAYMGHQKLITINMIIHAELRLPWYASIYSNDESIFYISREYVKRHLDMFDENFKSQYNINGMYNYFTMDEIINYHRSNGGWKGYLLKNVLKELGDEQVRVWKSLQSSKKELADSIITTLEGFEE